MKEPANSIAHLSVSSLWIGSSPGRGVPKSRPNSSRCASAQWRNSRHAAISLAVTSPPDSSAARALAARTPAAISVKISPQTLLSRSSRLLKYRYSAGAVIPIWRAISRNETAPGPSATRIRRAVSLISPVVAARTRSRRLTACTTRPPQLAERA